MTGIPSTPHPTANTSAQPISTAQQPTDSNNLFDLAAQASRALPQVPAVDVASLDVLRNNPQFNAMRELVRSQPHLLQPMLQQLAQSNPELIAVIL